ncbi:ABC transporter permease subunit [Sphaerisporangium fuscum]|uniref:ABC transporter permease subunit n=1 Tax=Sphaerisporangium fuscum TaxID=2835868 RepID=UPI001BDDA994|nr:ABC transporter permease subunit [Sphaerisporangium fuscum]
MTAYRTQLPPRRDGVGTLLRAEWTKFRTVRGWVIGTVAAALVTVLLGLMSAASTHDSCDNGATGTVCAGGPVGPDGQAVNDDFYFVHRTLNGDGMITVRVSSLTGRIRLPSPDPRNQGDARLKSGVTPWAKAGVMIKDGVRQGSAYAAMMVTGAHGVRMQYDFTEDVAGSPGGVSPASPRWLRLARSGDELTGYESGDGAHWTKVGSARLTGLPATVQVGLFAASPGAVTIKQGDFGGTIVQDRFAEATAVFDQVGLEGDTAPGEWGRDDIGVRYETDGVTPHHPGGMTRSGGTFTVTGVGDIGPGGEGHKIEDSLTGVLSGLIVIVVVAVLYVTAEYRRGLIRTTFLAGPRRGRVLAAKAVVIGAVAFAAGLAAAGAVVPLGTRILREGGNPMLPVSAFTELRVVVGVAALVAVIAVLALALGVVFRRGPAAITTVIALVVLPHILATSSVLPMEAGRWLLRLTPAAGFAVQQSVPRYPQVDDVYSPTLGYYPLPPWAGFAVLCAYAALALGLALFLLRRRDA